PKGALYCFAKMDQDRFNINNDEQMVLDLLEQQKMLIVHGTAFNWPQPDHFRVVFLPRPEDLSQAIDRMGQFFSNYRQA
ncbi:MAG: aminotransferase, partial [Oceanobacter sp.]